jgi:hypothetical protein
MPDAVASPNAVSERFTQSVAVLAHREFVAAGLEGMDAVSSARVAQAPLAIYDLGREPLFHDYALEGATGVAGTVRTAANRGLGSPLISVSHGAPGWDAMRAVRMATESLHATTPRAVVTSWRLVCYAYPKIGVELTYAVGSESGKELFDASSGGVVASVDDEAHQFTRYSLLRLLGPQAAARVEAFQSAEAEITKISKQPPVVFSSQLKKATVRLSPYCAGSPISLTHYAQITNYFCVDASAQMLLEHYGWNYTQNQIAQAMGTSPAQGGTTGTGLTTGFKSLTDGTLLLTFDGGASRMQQFADAMTEIDANRPLFTQVPHHYRVCVGYLEIVGSNLGFSFVSNQMLYIYDPWPWNADLCQPGASYWETWASSPVLWFGIVHHA